MEFTGRCYCGALRYKVDGEPVAKAQCHCRECQYISGGGPSYFIALPCDSFAYTRGKPTHFIRQDIDNPCTRDFCKTCGTHIKTSRPERPLAVVKVGTMDDPSLYGGANVAIFTCDMQDFHNIADGVQTFDKRPG